MVCVDNYCIQYSNHHFAYSIFNALQSSCCHDINKPSLYSSVRAGVIICVVSLCAPFPSSPCLSLFFSHLMLPRPEKFGYLSAECQGTTPNGKYHNTSTVPSIQVSSSHLCDVRLSFILLMFFALLDCLVYIFQNV